MRSLLEALPAFCRRLNVNQARCCSAVRPPAVAAVFVAKRNVDGSMAPFVSFDGLLADVRSVHTFHQVLPPGAVCSRGARPR